MLPLAPSPLAPECGDELLALPAQESVSVSPTSSPEKRTTTTMQCMRRIKVRDDRVEY